MVWCSLESLCWLVFQFCWGQPFLGISSFLGSLKRETQNHIALPCFFTHQSVCLTKAGQALGSLKLLEADQVIIGSLSCRCLIKTSFGGSVYAFNKKSAQNDPESTGRCCSSSAVLGALSATPPGSARPTCSVPGLARSRRGWEPFAGQVWPHRRLSGPFPPLDLCRASFSLIIAALKFLFSSLTSCTLR